MTPIETLCDIDPEPSWQQALARAIRDPYTLLARLGLPRDVCLGSEPAQDQFPLLVPESYVRRMRPGDPADPLLRQVLPIIEETIRVPGFQADPVADAPARRQPGLLQKYQGRALVIAHGSCAVHCRYCFRRQYPYGEEPRTWEDWKPAFEALATDESLHEVILSGGDPLVLSDRRLGELAARLEQIPHLRRLRIHTRLPIVLPQRVTDEFLSVFQACRLRTIVVVHANHANELVEDCAESLERLVRAGFPVLNQAVLLKGVNDSVEALAELCERCVDLGVIPYYLHQLDRVEGAAHFEVSAETGRRLIEALQSRLPGYAIPRYVQEVAGAPFKTPLI